MSADGVRAGTLTIHAGSVDGEVVAKVMEDLVAMGFVFLDTEPAPSYTTELTVTGDWLCISDWAAVIESAVADGPSYRLVLG